MVLKQPLHLQNKINFLNKDKPFLYNLLVN